MIANWKCWKKNKLILLTLFFIACESQYVTEESFKISSFPTHCDQELDMELHIIEFDSMIITSKYNK